MNHSWNVKWPWLSLFAAGFCSSSACNVDAPARFRRAPRGPTVPPRQVVANTPVDLTIVDQEEVDLVEAVASDRAAYHCSLEHLRDYYKAKGYATKESWAAFELKTLREVKAFRYLTDAEIASASLRPTEAVEEADAMYDRGLALMREGGRGVPVFYKQRKMIEASEVFRQLIERYPTSDKIDDAAFFLGEIHKEYLPGQETLAVKWYERALEWDPKTPHPVRFQAAVVHDYRLHDRDRALELYQSVVRENEGPSSNIRFAGRRIEELISSQRTAVASEKNP
jgi:tetratricopeptide (TPR) repeat protein